MAIPNFAAGAMENWGLLYRAIALLLLLLLLCPCIAAYVLQ
jgi:hypothetical protein